MAPSCPKFIHIFRTNLQVEKINLKKALHFGQSDASVHSKDVLRGRFKIYLADAAIAPAVMLKGKSILEDSSALGVATETAVLKHLYSRYYSQNVRFSYWRGKRDHEVDLIAEVGGQTIPFEVKYRSQHTGARELKGLLELCQQKSIERGYVVTKSLSDFGEITDFPKRLDTQNNHMARIMRIPAPLLCYWMGESEQATAN